MNTCPIVDIQIACDEEDIPPPASFELWVNAALQSTPDFQAAPENELTVRVVSSTESQRLNSRYRGKNKPTNVLSFPADLPEAISVPYLGDLILCAAVIKSEAHEQLKQVSAHWAHMTVHGSLHLLGYDHVAEADAQYMEMLETQIITGLGFPEPYA